MVHKAPTTALLPQRPSGAQAGSKAGSRHLCQGGAEALVGAGEGATEGGIHIPQLLRQPLLELVLQQPWCMCTLHALMPVQCTGGAT